MTGTAFFIDDRTGNNANDGLTSDSAWRTLERVHERSYQPGDRILFRRGGHWTGMFYPSGSGTAKEPILVDAYGEGDNPWIDGAGAEAAIMLKGLDNWAVHNLKCSNKATERSIRCGIKIIGRATGITSGIRIEGCEITDVTGENRRKMPFYHSMYWNSGIYASMPGRSTGEDHLDNIVIQDNFVHDVLTSGIRVNQDEDSKNDCHHTCVVVRGNRIQHTGSDGIIVANCNSPIIEYNRCYDAGALGNKEETHLIAGVWVCATQDALIQFNEVARTRLFDNDGTAFDTDWGTAGTTVFQYNYSHDNEGGFWLDCTSFHHNQACKGTVLRHNVSVNDHRCIVQADTGIDTLFENNQFINSTETGLSICVHADGKSHRYTGNTFVFSRNPAAGWQVSRYEGNIYANNLHNPEDKQGRQIADAGCWSIMNGQIDLDGKEELFGLSFQKT